MAADSYQTLFTVSNFANMGLVLVAFIVGLVVTLRRWHVGLAARLAAAAFALLILTTAGTWGLQVLASWIFSASGSDDGFYLRLAVLSSVSSLANVVSWGLLIFALRSSLNDVARLRSSSPHASDDAGAVFR